MRHAGWGQRKTNVVSVHARAWRGEGRETWGTQQQQLLQEHQEHQTWYHMYVPVCVFVRLV